MQLYEVLQLFFMRFYILKLLHNNFIINAINYISFNVYNQNQIIMHPLIFHSLIQLRNPFFIYFIIEKLIFTVIAMTRIL